MDCLHTESVERLFNAILNLETKEECYDFFEDICTIREILDIAQRLEVAGMLNGGKNYIEISTKTGASTATISRVNRSYLYGAGGYSKILKKIGEEK